MLTNKERELRDLREYYEKVVGDYRRELAHLQADYDRVASELQYVRTAVDSNAVDVARANHERDKWRDEAARASRAEKEAIGWTEPALEAVRAREANIAREVNKAGEEAFQRGWAQALYELEGEIEKGVALIRYEDDYSPYFKLHNEAMEDLLKRIRERGENWDHDESGSPTEFDDDQYTGDY